ncbi:uncharacterized protein LOC119010946 [Acanthopagrus latus]|uniref:uncharacterized protein LOC119010946 n=1 Tax=Acanthopagrus latus TaxID=8177 RepID=UPI00187BEE61|nr:uncharacterized protein LOC119010946 [Acanthopagrus latus]
MTPVVLLFAVSLLQSCETQGASSGSSVFVQTGNDLLLHVMEHVALDEESDFRWRFNGSTNIVKVDADNKTTIFKSYKSREISVQNYTLCLKNVQKADSGRYTAFVSGSKEQPVAEYEVTVLDPVSPVKLTVDSVSSSSDCNLTVTCSTLDSHISSTFTCDNKTCSQEGGERSDSSINVYQKQGFIICNHSNLVSFKQDELEIKDHCEQHPVPNRATLIGTASGSAVLGVVLVSICSFLICRYYKKKSNGNTIYEVPQEVTPAQTPQEDPADKCSGSSPTSTYCLLEFPTGQVKPTRDTSQPETVYAQVNRAAKTNARSPQTKTQVPQNTHS